MRTNYVELSEDASECYNLLKTSTDKFDQQLRKAIDRIIDILKQNYQFGDPVPKSLIPKSYLNKGINNLWRVELPGFWRLLYTIRGDKLEIVTFILEWMDHKRYNKLFGYSD